MTSIILAVHLIAVGCKPNKHPKDCSEYALKCYEDGLKAPEVQQYEIEYRKAFVINSCIRKANGKDGMRAK